MIPHNHPIRHAGFIAACMAVLTLPWWAPPLFVVLSAQPTIAAVLFAALVIVVVTWPPRGDGPRRERVTPVEFTEEPHPEIVPPSDEVVREAQRRAQT